jgi:hypothetical protein
MNNFDLVGWIIYIIGAEEAEKRIIPSGRD